MRGVFIVLVTAALAGYVAAECANACSGHGDCSTRHDYCICWDGWMGSSCDQRVCPRALAHIDTPIGDLNYDNALNSGGVSTLNPMQQRAGAWERHPAQLYGGQSSDGSFYAHDEEAHFYTECANRGICDRATGLCDCFTGYEGAACNRTSCVNGCSGHGTCQTLTDVVPSNIHYRLWETDKTQVCKCDGGYFGIDCSQKKCAKNNDPLTAYSTKLNYNYGIAERDEVQYVDIRCPYNGQMIYPSASLLYTDAQFGDVYETVKFDFSASNNNAAAHVLAALKGLPNEVLSDNWNPVSGTMQKVKDVEVLHLEDNNHYRIVVTFNSLLGDVPSLSGKAYFKCQGGAEVISSSQNVAVSYVGDGPLLDLTFKFTRASASTVDVAITDFTGASYASLTAVAVQNAAANGVLTSSGFTQAAVKEASKVRFAFGLADVQTEASFTVKVHVTPVIKTFNPTYALAGSVQTMQITSGTTGTYRLSFLTIKTDYIAYDGTLSGTSNANTAAMEKGLNALSSISPGFVKVVSDGATGAEVFTVTFYGVDAAWGNLISRVTTTGTGTPQGTLTATFGAVAQSAITATAHTLKADSLATATFGVTSSQADPTIATYSSYDTTYSVKCLNAGCTLARLKLNGETVGLVDLSGTTLVTVQALLEASAGALLPGAGPAYVSHALPAKAGVRSSKTAVAVANPALDLEWSWGLPKLPLVYTNLVDSYTAHTDAGISWSFFQDVATSVPSNVILKISTITSSPDRYQWKLAGDIQWQAERSVTSSGSQCLAAVVTGVTPTACDSGLGVPGTGAGTQNKAWRDYVALDQDDPAHREINRLRITFVSTDEDARIACTAANSASYYYFQFGSDGINDSPECSDRGVCDYSSGICKCFKGYNGIDCSSQSALAAGASGGSVAAA